MKSNQVAVPIHFLGLIIVQKGEGMSEAVALTIEKIRNSDEVVTILSKASVELTQVLDTLCIIIPGMITQTNDLQEKIIVNRVVDFFLGGSNG
jgi:hypothetical protein